MFQIILALRKLECYNCNCILYVNFIRTAANKSLPIIYDFCMLLVLHFVPFMTKITVQHKGDTFPILTDLNYSYQTYHFETISFYTYQSNCYSKSIHCKAIIIFIADTYL